MSNTRLQCWLGGAFLFLTWQIFCVISEGGLYAGAILGFLLIPATVILSFMFSIAVGLRKPPSKTDREK